MYLLWFFSPFYQEYILENFGEATDSTSLLREHGALEDLVHGGEDHFPFLPGGIGEKKKYSEQEQKYYNM